MSFYDNILDKLATPSPWTASNESALLEPFTYLNSNPGKDVLDKLIGAFDTWLNIPSHSRGIISKVVNMLHNASLMVDDIQDDSQLRRGSPVAHSVYGVPQTLNAANYVYFLAYQELLGLKTPRLSDHDLAPMVTDELLSLHRGQGLELMWRDSLNCPTEEEYVYMVNNKTGGLLRLGVKLMMACATTNINTNYVPVMNLIGVYYQIRDDLMNLQSPLYSNNKGFAEDLSEGKFSFPIVHSMRADTSNLEILNVLQKRPSTPTLKNHAIQYMKTQTKSFEYTLNVLERLEKQARAEVKRLGGNPGLDAILDVLHVDGASLG
ncbi:isoprenoid synthase domain-containing protein [Mycena galericulata]|nr:isoprenoid synthase domain-containing protein [Mycena galericulata]